MSNEAANSPIKATTAGMVGQQFYDKNSTPQWNTIAHVLPWLGEAVKELPSETQFRLVDIGCSEGGNSMRMLDHVVKALRENHSGPISIVESDLPSNDYSKILEAMGYRSTPPFTDPLVFGGIVSGSMYDQLLPAHSAHLITTFNAIGFLSHRPVERIKNHIVCAKKRPTLNVENANEEHFGTFLQCAHNDLELFLQARAHELVSGGKLLVQVFGKDDRIKNALTIFEAPNDALIELVEKGEISRDIYERYYHPVTFRTLDQLLAPVTAGTGKFASAFKIERTESYEVQLPFVEQFKKDGNVEQYAHQMTNFFRAFMEAVLKEALEETGRAEELVEAVFKRSEELIVQYPDRYQFHYVSVAMLLTYTGE
ncbi:class I SAM-dependent methyltransferase [Flexibacterium corallicola]|uniref:hypothetical protein n=1 Tax=Flexibacterium corallicola TaxID=3037259 RepID=UPI00286EE097|nr:hypothetical protein [Pseudovibrio sp. M1P-2-3]